MRILSWNMDQQGHAGSHPEAWAFLRTIDPDIALLQEAIVPEDIYDQYEVLWNRAWDNKPWVRPSCLVLETLCVTERTDPGEPSWWRTAPPGARLHPDHARIIDQRVVPALRLTFDALRTHLGDRFIVGGDLNTARAAGPRMAEERTRRVLERPRGLGVSGLSLPI